MPVSGFGGGEPAGGVDSGDGGPYLRSTAVREERRVRAAATAVAPSGLMALLLHIFI